MKALNRRAAAALLLAASVASGSAAAQETGFVLEDSVREQIFHQLKADFDSLYRRIAAETQKDTDRREQAPAVNGEPSLRSAARDETSGSGIAL